MYTGYEKTNTRKNPFAKINLIAFTWEFVAAGIASLLKPWVFFLEIGFQYGHSMFRFSQS